MTTNAGLTVLALAAVLVLLALSCLFNGGPGRFGLVLLLASIVCYCAVYACSPVPHLYPAAFPRIERA